MNKEQHTDKITFIIPEHENKITREDISKSEIRITSELKKYFSSEYSEIEVIINNVNYNVKLNFMDYEDKSRSYKLKIGKDAMIKLNIQEGDSIKVTVIDDKTYQFEKIDINQENAKKRKDFFDFCNNLKK